MTDSVYMYYYNDIWVEVGIGILDSKLRLVQFSFTLDSFEVAVCHLQSKEELRSQ